MESSDKEQASEGLTEEQEKHSEFMKLYGGFMQYGLNLFEPDGKLAPDGPGIESLELLLKHFEEREAYGRCEFVQGLIMEYKKRWPDK